LDLDLDFTAYASSLGMFAHEIVQFLNSVGIWARSNIQQKRELGLEVLADTLEEPFVRVDFTVITLLDAEHEVDPASLEQGLVYAKVPRCALKAMQKVVWHILGIHLWVTHISHVLHLELLVTIQVHKALLEEDFFV